MPFGVYFPITIEPISPPSLNLANTLSGNALAETTFLFNLFAVLVTKDVSYALSSFHLTSTHSASFNPTLPASITFSFHKTLLFDPADAS